MITSYSSTIKPDSVNDSCDFVCALIVIFTVFYARESTLLPVAKVFKSVIGFEFSKL